MLPNLVSYPRLFFVWQVNQLWNFSMVLHEDVISCHLICSGTYHKILPITKSVFSFKKVRVSHFCFLKFSSYTRGLSSTLVSKASNCIHYAGKIEMSKGNYPVICPGTASNSLSPSESEWKTCSQTHKNSPCVEY